MAKALSETNTDSVSKADADEAPDLPICGMVRPIATMGEAYPETHWLEVHELVAEAARNAGYRLRLVSESDQVGIIVSEIIRNLHENPIVIVDVSGRNPNVMFELGMRVTFQKPVVIITDDHTPFSFDIQAIRHVQYRRDLRTGPTRKFQSELTTAIAATVEAAGKAGHKGYLQQFGKIEVTGIADQSISLDELAQSVRDLRTEIRTSAVRSAPSYNRIGKDQRQKFFSVRVGEKESSIVEKIMKDSNFMTTVEKLQDGSVRFTVPGIGTDSGKWFAGRFAEAGVSIIPE